MPNKQRKSKNKSRRGAGNTRTVRVPFHAFDAITTSGSIGSINVTPNATFSGRANSISDVFDEYRLVAFKYRLRNDQSTPSNAAAIAYYPGVTSTLPASLTVIGENPYISARYPDDDVQPPYIRVPRGVLAGEQPWYKCQKATLSSDDSLPGQILAVATGASDQLAFEVDGIFEFRGEADPANTPLDPQCLPRKIALLNLRVALFNTLINKDRDSLLKLLNYKEQLTVIPQLTLGSTTVKWPQPKL
jgi:hypothetical protein